MKHHRNPVNKKKKTGLSPGTLVYTGEQKSEQPLLSGIQYNVLNIEHLDETVCLKTKCQEGFQYWFDVRGIHDVELIARIGEQFNINKLILEDVMDPGQRIKIEDYESAVFVVLSNLEYDKASGILRKEQIAIYVTEQFIISFQENPDDTFSVLRDRMSMEGSKTRSRGTDYLLYALLDYLVDKYFLILDAFSDEIEIQEERVYQKEFELSMEELYQLRNHIVSLKRLIFPLREELSQLKNMDSKLIQEPTYLYIRDLNDHIRHIIESLDNQREIVNGIRELALSKTNLMMNRDMKWLTVVSTVSIPILFFTGVYGMNFKYMPELSWRYGYLIWWVAVTLVVFAMVAFLKKKKMFGS